MRKLLAWRPTPKQVSGLLGTVLLLSQAFNSGPEKPTLIAAALGLFLGTPVVMRFEEQQRKNNRNGHRDP